jgi:hypothetical protein
MAWTPPLLGMVCAIVSTFNLYCPPFPWNDNKLKWNGLLHWTTLSSYQNGVMEKILYLFIYYFVFSLTRFSISKCIHTLPCMLFFPCHVNPITLRIAIVHFSSHASHSSICLSIWPLLGHNSLFYCVVLCVFSILDLQGYDLWALPWSTLIVIMGSLFAYLFIPG